MSQLRLLFLAILAVVAGLLGDITSMLAAARGWPVPVMHWVSLVTLLAVAAGVVIGGVRVYRTRNRTAKRALSPLVAFRVLLLAQAAAYAGAALGGWHAGVLVDLVAGGGFGSGASWAALIQVIGGVVLVIVGFVVQAWCKIPPEDSSGQGGGEGAEGVEGAH
ncbi:MAG: DUF3180 domain-containing protein [Arthrobacter sp.]|jgi:hypothetical protein|nr:DUF3180 domain-containing protein [Arthrobacter sp.]